MAELKFLPEGTQVPADSGTKVLAVAIRHKIPLRFGCASCRCGTCAVAISGPGEVFPMEADEEALLARMLLAVDGSVRLACRCKVKEGLTEVDLSFQDTYSPDQGEV